MTVIPLPRNFSQKNKTIFDQFQFQGQETIGKNGVIGPHYAACPSSAKEIHLGKNFCYRGFPA
jgi:hypothetical protein